MVCSLQVFNIYIKRVAEVYGVTHTRPIYEKAIEVLAEDKARDMCLRFADLERKLGEIDRARAVYAHCSQICDPRVSWYQVLMSRVCRVIEVCGLVEIKINC